MNCPRGFIQTVMSQLLGADFHIVAIPNYYLSSSRQRRATNKYTNDASHRISLPAPCGSAYDNFNLSDLSDLLMIRLHPIAFTLAYPILSHCLHILDFDLHFSIHPSLMTRLRTNQVGDPWRSRTPMSHTDLKTNQALCHVKNPFQVASDNVR